MPPSPALRAAPAPAPASAGVGRSESGAGAGCGRLSAGRVLVFDTETTGVDPARDRVVELGAAYFENGRPLRRHRMLVHPGCPIPPGATEVHGICDADVAHAPAFDVVGARLSLHLSGAVFDGVAPILCGYNAATFDAPLLNAELARHGLAARIEPSRVVDPYVFMKWHHRDLRGRKLTDACRHYGIALDQAHSAAADAAATGLLLFAMVSAGRIPDELGACLSEQARLDALVEAEYAEWRTWLYRDRATGELRLGAGKHVGCAPHAVDPGWFRYVLDNVVDLPPAVRETFRRHC